MKIDLRLLAITTSLAAGSSELAFGQNGQVIVSQTETVKFQNKGTAQNPYTYGEFRKQVENGYAGTMYVDVDIPVKNHCGIIGKCKSTDFNPNVAKGSYLCYNSPNGPLWISEQSTSLVSADTTNQQLGYQTGYRHGTLLLNGALQGLNPSNGSFRPQFNVGLYFGMGCDSGRCVNGQCSR